MSWRFASDREKCRKMTGEHKRDFSSFHDNNIHYCEEPRFTFANHIVYIYRPQTKLWEDVFTGVCLFTWGGGGGMGSRGRYLWSHVLSMGCASIVPMPFQGVGMSGGEVGIFRGWVCPRRLCYQVPSAGWVCLGPGIQGLGISEGGYVQVGVGMSRWGWVCPGGVGYVQVGVGMSMG